VFARSAFLVSFASALAACGEPSLDDTRFSCASQADCDSGYVCGRVSGQRACVPAEQTPIRVGMSGPLQGPSQDLGGEMRRGIEARFAEVNRAGGLFGRRVELDCRNDDYDPEIAAANVETLLDIREKVADPDQADVRGDNGVLALLGNIGTPTMLRTAPIADKNKVVFFAPFTGAQRYLRDGTNSPYVYNYRAGYFQETEAMVDYLANYRAPRVLDSPESYRRLLAFTQNDSYGDAGYEGFVRAYNQLIGSVPQPDSAQPNPSIRRVRYERENLASVDPAIEEAKLFLDNLSKTEPPGKIPVGILMVDTYDPGNRFIRAVKDFLHENAERAAQFDVVFLHVSFVGSDSLSQALMRPPAKRADATDPTGQKQLSYAAGVIVTQVVPYYKAESPGVTDYRNAIKQYDNAGLSFTSLEGYVAARLFLDALAQSGAALDPEDLLRTLNTQMQNRDLGLGTMLSFSPTNHQASHTVWGSMLSEDGSFTMPFVWTPQTRIVPGIN
jgi:ABC-type branched-subunit amino acid transport system substrate-binding protein